MIKIPIEAQPTAERLIFMSGDEVFLVRTVPMTKRGKRILLCYMIPTEHVRWRYGITDDMMNYNIHSAGTIAREYEEEYFHRLPENPENRMALMFCNFDGTVTIESDIQMLKEKIERTKSMLADAITENQSLRERVREMSEIIRVLDVKPE